MNLYILKMLNSCILVMKSLNLLKIEEVEVVRLIVYKGEFL